jgi:sensor histidine kinase regulating citrate/malate metabolism
MTDQKLPVLLVVEDDEGLQRQLKWAYEGYEVVLAGDRASAFEARSLVVAMGGRLGVDSQPGRGTTFTILLPAAEPERQDIRKSA